MAFFAEDVSLFTRNFQYLSADRISPKASYDVSDYYIKDLNSLGNHGEYTAHYVAEKGFSPLFIKELKHPDSSSLTLLDNLDKWMSEISPGIRIHVNLHPAMNTVSLNYAFQQGNDMTADFKPQGYDYNRESRSSSPSRRTIGIRSPLFNSRDLRCPAFY